MKERPILFSASMVRAILDGRKTQTRRIWKQPTSLCLKDDFLYADPHQAKDGHNPIARDEIICPYGRPGDRLWVRETFCGYPPSVFYRATEPGGDTDAMEPPVWTPSIHMPRAASRITLEITGVRVERLQDISEADAMAEGVLYTDFGTYIPPGTASIDGGKTFHPFKPRQHNGFHVLDVNGPEQCHGTARNAFAALWNSINGPESWTSNPWIWAIKFERIKP